jgi:hypothetical protein
MDVTERRFVPSFFSAALALALLGTLALSPASALARSQQTAPLSDRQGSPSTSASTEPALVSAGAYGPVVPIPSTLWKPAAGAVPASGDYVYLKSDVGDFVDPGKSFLYTRTNAVLTVSASGGLLTVGVQGDKHWNGDFATMSSITDLEPGYYPNVEEYPSNDPTCGSLNWSGDGRGVGTLTGWFAVDNVTYDNGDLTAITLRFELHPGGNTPALYGAIHWQADDTTEPPGPRLPIPGSLWQPAAGVVPASGNYAYLESDPGEFIGAGRAYLYTPANATFSIHENGAYFTITLDCSEQWEGEFHVMAPLTDIEPGYYPGLETMPGNPAKGDLLWGGDGRSNGGTGWFVVDDVAYTDGTPTTLDLRFEQGTGAGQPALHGVVHWDAATTQSQTATTLTLSVPVVSAFGSARLSGALTGAGAQPVAGATVTIRSTTGGPWTTLGTVTTDASGRYGFTATPTVIAAYQAVFTGADTEAGSVSAPVATLPQVYLSKPSAPRSAHAGAAITCSCYLKPHHATGKYAVLFEFERRVSRRWVIEGAVKAKAATYHGYSKCSARVRLLVRGWWRVRAVHPKDSLNAATLGPWRAIRVT